jgi:hypothetical protein
MENLWNQLDSVDRQYEEYLRRGTLHVWRSRMQAIREEIRRKSGENGL